MAYLQEALDDPNPAPCGRCSVCTGALPHPGTAPSKERLVAASAYLRGTDHVIEPRKLWPSGVSRRSNINGIGEGRAVAFADDPGWADELLALQRTGYGTIPPELLTGAIETLTRWSRTWATRPVGVAAAPAASVEQRANRVLAEHIASIGRLPLLDLFEWSGGPSPTDSSSTPLVAHLEQSIRLLGPTDVPEGPILLCATTMRTGWSLTVAGALLYDAEGRTTMPLVIHRLP
jgi:ATP-dependent DNA helicase RecQ